MIIFAIIFILAIYEVIYRRHKRKDYEWKAIVRNKMAMERIKFRLDYANQLSIQRK